MKNNEEMRKLYESIIDLLLDSGITDAEIADVLFSLLYSYCKMSNVDFMKFVTISDSVMRDQHPPGVPPVMQ